jgi:serine/threonine protein kinase
MEHPNIVNNLEIYDNPEAVYIVMEYIKGIDLFDWLIKLNSRD